MFGWNLRFLWFLQICNHSPALGYVWCVLLLSQTAVFIFCSSLHYRGTTSVFLTHDFPVDGCLSHRWLWKNTLGNPSRVTSNMLHCQIWSASAEIRWNYCNFLGLENKLDKEGQRLFERETSQHCWANKKHFLEVHEALWGRSAWEARSMSDFLGCAVAAGRVVLTLSVL